MINHYRGKLANEFTVAPKIFPSLWKLEIEFNRFINMTDNQQYKCYIIIVVS